MVQIRPGLVPCTRIVTVASSAVGTVLNVPPQTRVTIGHETEPLRIWYEGTDGGAVPSSSTAPYDFIPAGNLRTLSFVGPAYPRDPTGLISIVIAAPSAQAAVYVPVRVELPDVPRELG